MAKNVREKERVERKKVDAEQWLKSQTAGGEATGVKLPDGIGWWKPKQGINRIDIIPFVTGKGNPKADEGYEHWERQYYRHFVQGFDGRSKPVCCLGNWNEPCPICQYVATLPKETKEQKEVVSSIKGKLQMLVNVVDLDDREKDKIHVWESVFYNMDKGFGEQLVTLLAANRKFLAHADLEKGYTLVLNVKEAQGFKSKYNFVSRIDFEERKYAYPDSMIERTACLDDCLVKKTYKELKQYVTMTPPDDDEPAHDEPVRDEPAHSNGRQEEPKRREEPRKPDPEPDVVVHTEIEKGSTVTHPEFGKCDVVDVRGDKVKLMDSRNKPHVANAKDCFPYDEKPPEDEWEKQPDPADEWPDDPEPPKRGRK